MTVRDSIKGFFRSKIFFQGEYYDTEWEVNPQFKGGVGTHEIRVKKCVGGNPRDETYALNYNVDFHAALLRRARQIKDSNSKTTTHD